MCCRKGGTVSIPGVYIAFLDKIPFGAAMNKGLSLRMGQTHVQRYLQPLLQTIEAGKIDPSFVITHRLPLDEAPRIRPSATKRTVASVAFAQRAIGQGRGTSRDGVQAATAGRRWAA